MRLLIVLLALMAGCNPMDGRPCGKTREPPPADGAQCIVRLTWTNYSGLESTEQARFILNGDPIGVGQTGFRRALAAIPVQSQVIVYPFYPLMNEPSGPNRQVPFDLNELARWGETHPGQTMILSVDATPNKGVALVLKHWQWLPLDSE